MPQANQQTTTRRDVLTNVGLCAVVAPTVPFTALALTEPNELDAEIFAFRPRLIPLRAEFDAALDALNRAERAYHAVKLTRPRMADTPVNSISLVNGVVTTTLDYDAAVKAYHAAMEVWQTDDERLRDECGMNEADHRINDGSDLWNEIADELLAMRAKTLAGILFKIEQTRALADEPALLDSVADDIAAIVAGGEQS